MIDNFSFLVFITCIKFHIQTKNDDLYLNEHNGLDVCIKK